MDLVEGVVGWRSRSGSSSRSAWPLTAGAQTPPGAATTEPYTPAKDAKDLKAVLFNWMWGMGMLKGHDERDMVAHARISGQGHHPGGRATVHADEISCEHELPDLQSADSVRLHAGERTDVLEHRSGQRAVRLERGHARRGDRCNKGEGDADGGGRAGAADPHLGKSAGRAQGRVGRDDGDIPIWGPTRARCSRTVSRRWATRPCRGRRASRS